MDRAANPRGAIAVAATPAGPGTGACTTAAAATATAFSGGGLVDADHAAHPLHILQVVDGALLRLSIGQLDKCKASFAARFPIEGEAALAHLAISGEQVNEILAFGFKREVANVNGHS